MVIFFFSICLGVCIETDRPSITLSPAICKPAFGSLINECTGRRYFKFLIKPQFPIQRRSSAAKLFKYLVMIVKSLSRAPVQQFQINKSLLYIGLKIRWKHRERFNQVN